MLHEIRKYLSEPLNPTRIDAIAFLLGMITTGLFLRSWF